MNKFNLKQIWVNEFLIHETIIINEINFNIKFNYKISLNNSLTIRARKYSNSVKKKKGQTII